MQTQPVFEVCDSSQVLASSSTSAVAYGTCSNPYWVPQPSMFPQLSGTDGALIGFAIFAVWTAAYMGRALRLKD